MFVKDKCIKAGMSCSDYKHETADLSVDDCKNLKTTIGGTCYWTTGKSCTYRECS